MGYSQRPYLDYSYNRRGVAAEFQVLFTGYVGDHTASTVSFVRDGDVRVIIDPGMVPEAAGILDPLEELVESPEQITDVILSHHHPDHTLNAALFPRARNTPQDITTIVSTTEGTVAFTHLWWSASGPVEDPYASDPSALHRNRARVLEVAGLIVPGHGAPFKPSVETPR